MSALIREQDLELIRKIPELDLVELAVDLDILVPAQINRTELMERCLYGIVERAKSEGLPFSKYDLGDLQALRQADLEAIGRLLQVKRPITAEKVLKKGLRVYKYYRKNRPNNATALLVPTLLPLIARACQFPRT
jgi:hypothetical protein